MIRVLSLGQIRLYIMCITNQTDHENPFLFSNPKYNEDGKYQTLYYYILKCQIKLDKYQLNPETNMAYECSMYRNIMQLFIFLHLNRAFCIGR